MMGPQYISRFAIWYNIEEFEEHTTCLLAPILQGYNMNKLASMSDEELARKLKAARSIQITVGVIFGLIILTWLILGYWRSNVPVFISTIAMGLTTLAITSVVPQGIAKELQRRRTG